MHKLLPLLVLSLAMFTQAAESQLIIKVRGGHNPILSWMTGGEVTYGDWARVTEMLNPYPNGTTYYTIDGSEPSFISTPFTTGFTFEQPLVVKAIAYNAGFTEHVRTEVKINVVPIVILYVHARSGPRMFSYKEKGIVEPQSAFLYGGVSSIRALSNSIVQLTAVTGENLLFTGWRGAVESTNPVIEIKMDREKAVEFEHLITNYTTVVNGKGRIEVDPPPPYHWGQPVKLTAIPEEGYGFASWPGVSRMENPRWVAMSSGTNRFEASFVPLGEEIVTLQLQTDYQGVLDVIPKRFIFGIGESVTIGANPSIGNAFTHWSGDASGTNPMITLVMDGHKTIMAHGIRFPISSYDAAAICTALDDEGNIYHANDRRLNAFSPEGNLKWVARTDIGPAGAVVSPSGHIILHGYVSSPFGLDWEMQAYSPDGRKAWTIPLTRSGPILVNSFGEIFLIPSRFNLDFVRVDSGGEVGARVALSSDLLRGAIDSQDRVVLLQSGKVSQYDHDLNLLWSRPVQEPNSLIIGAHDSIYVGSRKVLVKFDSSGNQVWQKLYERPALEVMLADEQRVFAVANPAFEFSSSFVSLDAENGAELWRTREYSGLQQNALLTEQGDLYFLTKEPLHHWDYPVLYMHHYSRSGEPLLRMQISDYNLWTPTMKLSRQGKLFFDTGAENRKVWEIKLDTPPSGVWPMHGGDWRNSGRVVVENGVGRMRTKREQAGVRVQFVGRYGRSFRLQASPNLSGWSDIESFSGSLDHLVTPSEAERYFRVIAE